MIWKVAVYFATSGVLFACLYVESTPAGSSSINALPEAKNVEVASEESLRFTESLPEEIRWMSEYAPVFQMNGDDIEIIQDLDTFRKILLEQIRLAERRVVLDSLYFGTGNSTDDLAETLRSSLSSHPDLQVTILTDYNCVVEALGNSCPALLKEHGDRIRELNFGNLDFLENEQNRYMFLRGSRHLVDFCEELVISVASASYQIQPDYSLKIRTGVQDFRNATDSGSVEAYKQEFKARIEQLFNSYNKRNHSNQCDIHDNCDTWIVPLVQMGQFNIRLLSDVMEEFLGRTSENSHATLSTPYLNLPDNLERIMLYDSEATVQIVTTSQETSSVYTQIPTTAKIQLELYTMFEREFYSRLSGAGQKGRISLHEFVRSGWTYHAKGLWYYPPGHDSPTLSFVGSSNFNRQSTDKNLESDFVVFTKNENIKKQLKREHDTFLSFSRLVNEEALMEEETPLDIKLMSLMFKNYL